MIKGHSFTLHRFSVLNNFIKLHTDTIKHFDEVLKFCDNIRTNQESVYLGCHNDEYDGYMTP
jgi:hypothetical protein